MDEETLSRGLTVHRNIQDLRRMITEIEGHDNIAQIASTLLWGNKIGNLGELNQVKAGIIAALTNELIDQEQEFKSM